MLQGLGLFSKSTLRSHFPFGESWTYRWSHVDSFSCMAHVWYGLDHSGVCLYSELLSTRIPASPILRFPEWLGAKESTFQCRRCRFDPWVGKSPWRRKLQPIPVFMPGESHGEKSPAGYSPWGHKESDTTSQLNNNPSPWLVCQLPASYSFVTFIFNKLKSDPRLLCLPQTAIEL